jgi:hypothetical protein
LILIRLTQQLFLMRFLPKRRTWLESIWPSMRSTLESKKRVVIIREKSILAALKEKKKIKDIGNVIKMCSEIKAVDSEYGCLLEAKCKVELLSDQGTYHYHYDAFLKDFPRSVAGHL